MKVYDQEIKINNLKLNPTPKEIIEQSSQMIVRFNAEWKQMLATDYESGFHSKSEALTCH